MLKTDLSVGLRITVMESIGPAAETFLKSRSIPHSALISPDIPLEAREILGMKVLERKVQFGNYISVIKMSNDLKLPERVRRVAAESVEVAGKNAIQLFVKGPYTFHEMSSCTRLSDEVRKAAADSVAPAISMVAAEHDRSWVTRQELLKLSQCDGVLEPLREAAGMQLVGIYAESANYAQLMRVHHSHCPESVRKAAADAIERVSLKKIEAHVGRGLSGRSALLELSRNPNLPPAVRGSASDAAARLASDAK